MKKEAVKRVPDFHGVPGEMVLADQSLGLEFGNRLRKSPYDALLDKLAQAEPGKYWLKFGNLRARPSIYARAKKKKMIVSFAERGDDLYVRLESTAQTVAESVLGKRRTEALRILSAGPMTHMALAAALRSAGDAEADGSTVLLMAGRMVKEGLVIRREDGSYALPVRARRG